MISTADGRLTLSPTDLANHLACRHLTTLTRKLAAGRIDPPQGYNPRADALAERGQRHEKEYLDHLCRQGLRVERAPEASAQATWELMEQGVDVIAQATLASGRWQGRADVLLRVEHEVEQPSGLWAWSYEVVDTKLGGETKATTILQLCTYSLLLEDIQECRPLKMHVVPPGRDFKRESYILDDYAAYFRRVRHDLQQEIDAEQQGEPTYPHPTPHCDVCRWWQECEDRRRQDDHLCLVAGMARLHETELRDWGVTTRSGLASLPLPLDKKPNRGSLAVFERLREQARIQVESPEGGPPNHERLPVEEGLGLARLPEPSPGDVFLDFEGDPFVGELGLDTGEQGLEYLIGWVTTGADGEPEYHRIWATTRQEERAAFERLMDDLMERWSRDSGFHIYHFSPYEPGAMKRLMGRYATREEEMDRLLRGGRFVDLHGVVRQGLRVGVESYSLKNLEVLCGFEREQQLREASHALRQVELALELGLGETISQEDRETVELYNRDDCLSASHLRDWLEGIRTAAVEEGEEIPRPELQDGEPPEKWTEWQKKIRPIQEQLHEGLPDDPAAHNEEQRARWILGHILEFHNRENKVAWWDFFRLAEMAEDERYDEPKAIAGMKYERRIPRPGKKGRLLLPNDRYTFPSQEVDERSDEARITADSKLGKIVEVNGREGWVVIQKREDSLDNHPPSIFMFTYFKDSVLQNSLLRFAKSAVERGMTGDGPYRSARDLLLKRRPRLHRRDEALRREDESSLQSARRLALELDGGVLPIQGPPGSGKTYTGARMILDLVRAGKKVGITALSHKVIRNLLDKVVDAAREEGVPAFRCIQKISSRAKPAKTKSPIEETQGNPRILKALQSGEMNVAGGTAWLWADETLKDSVDVLFVDEAAQLSLATTLAAAQAARNLVLIGDPQQLEQPIQGTHPYATGTTALEHLLGDAETMPRDRGLFLGETFRLHPEICSFTSDLYYEGRLRPRSENSRQALHGPDPFDGPGLYWVPVEHEGNQSRCDEEAEVVERLIQSWLDHGAEWTNQHGVRQSLNWDHVLIVVPYNAQVARLKERLPDIARIGTVDKFQGQEAPVVVYSMTTSSPEEAPHGLEFLYNRHRLNVATSRARCAAVLVASPKLLDPQCRTPRQMLLANGLCEFVERAREVSLPV